jgi:glycosyltransferase involved in cell wall biosynthesis
VKIGFVDMDNLQNNFYNYARYGRRLGLESYVVLPREEETFPWHQPAWSDPAARTGDPEWVLRAEAPRDPLGAPLAYLRREAAAVRTMRDFDGIVCSGLGLMWGRWAHRPFVFISFGPDLDQLARYGWSGNPAEYKRPGWVRRLGHRVRRRRYLEALPHAARAIVSPHQAVLARELGLRELRWMNHVLDLEVFHPLSTEERTAERARLRSRFPGDHVVCVGSRCVWRNPELTDYKGTDLILRSLARIRSQLPGPLRVLMVEKGWDLEETRTLVASLGLTDVVSWLPPMPRPELARVYAAADVVLDQFGVGILALVAVEAMASGAAVFTKLPQVPEAPFYAEPPTFTHVGDGDALADRLLEVLSREDERQRRANAAADWARRNCHWSIGMGQLVAVLREIMPIPLPPAAKTGTA